MNILVIGSGGREHALVWKFNQSKKVDKIFCAPGNAGIQQIAECVDISVNDIQGLINFAKEQNIGLTVVGPEDPLTNGIVDAFENEDMRIFGPSGAAAELEGSKVFTKDFLKKYRIPSAKYKVFTKRSSAKKYIDKIGLPCVIKADGLAAGKGVLIAETKADAKNAIDLIMKDKAFGDAGNKVVVEEFLKGEEASYIAFTDGKTVLPLPSSQDHKAIFVGDKGPNTGGMGAYSPAPVLTDVLEKRVIDEVMIPTLKGMEKEGRPYKGMLYAGLMINDNEIKVLEFNCRFGDPECQPLLFRLQSDLVEIMDASIDGCLYKIKMQIDPRPTVCVVLASEGYPGKSIVGKTINGLDDAAGSKDTMVFHAGTAINNDDIVNAGGRVLGVTAIGSDIATAIDNAYKTIEKINWEGFYYRNDIGHRALARLREQGDPEVGIIMGSDSDLPVMMAAADFLKSIGINYEITISSAHRTPEKAAEYSRTAAKRGLKIIIAGAGMAAHLAGVLAAHTTLPVLGVPIDASSLNGLDALLSTVQMPPGIPVGTMGIGKSGAKNAAVLAARILAINNQEITQKLNEFSENMAIQVAEKNKALAK